MSMSKEEIIHALKEMLRCNGIEEGGFNEIESNILQETLNLIEKQNNRIEELEREKDKLLEKYNERVQEIIDLEKELEPIRELNIPAETLVAEYERLENIEDDREQLKHSIKENQKIISNYIADYCKRCDELRDSIPKSVIREKLDELETIETNKNMNIMARSSQIDILKELLAEEI